MFTKLLNLFKPKQDKDILALRAQLDIVELRLSLLEDSFASHIHCDGTSCDPFPELTAEESKATMSSNKSTSKKVTDSIGDLTGAFAKHIEKWAPVLILFNQHK